MRKSSPNWPTPRQNAKFKDLTPNHNMSAIAKFENLKDLIVELRGELYLRK